MTNQPPRFRQRGFFTVGVGLMLLALFGAMGATLDLPQNGQKEVVMQQDLEAAPRQAFLGD